MSYILDHFVENFASIYFATYFGAVAIVALWEYVAPRRRLDAPLRLRWTANFSVTVIGSTLWQLLIPVTGISIAVVASVEGWGIFNVTETPYAVSFFASLLLIDFGRYGFHYVLHNLPVLWRLHRMHHTDQDYDFTTGLRFHPFEVLLTALWILVMISILGAPIAAVATSELMLVLLAMFSHGNIRILPSIERVVRIIFITPEMHRIHHSADFNEHNSNYGNLFPWWDWICGTYKAQPAKGHISMRIGLLGCRDIKHLKSGQMLLDPFLQLTDNDHADGLNLN